ncbi:S8 family serine peptidase [Streptomyces sp. NPDC097619]|uniref:S8 family peptidase n=1 Tax=Streptomyces sp. NPDC097619 TaxID=3157228 RepID=UPI00332E35D2
MRKGLNRAGAASVAAAATVALVAGLTSPSTAAPHDFGSTAATPAGASGAQGLTRVTLVTGDRVVVDAKGRAVGLEPAAGRQGIPVSVQRRDGHTSVVPLDAQRLIAEGRLDARLFDVTELSKEAYRARDGRLQLIVGYQGAAPAARSALRAADDTRIGRTFPSLGAEAVSATPSGAAAVWEALTEGGGERRTLAAGIAKVWLDGIRTASLDKSTKQIGADKAWAAGYTGKGVKIAVLDTGVDATHPDLSTQVVAAKNFTPAPDAKDRFGHGTHVASIAAGTGAKSGGKFKGVAPGAKLLNGKVLDDNGSGDDSGILAGIEWAVAQGADIVNLSLGGPDGPDLDVLESAVNKISADKGVLFAIAAGNSGPGARSVGSPGSAEAALTVGAVDDKDKLAEFSSRGPRIGDGGIKPDVTAPGVDTTAAAAPGSVIEREVGQNPPGYLTISGTSMATPHVAGAAALLKQQHPSWKGAQLKGVLTASTKPGKYTAFEQGSGRIAVDKAIKQTLVADPVSLGFGVQQWPHQDDKPVTKNLVYRNLGTTAVTLDLAVAAYGPDGKAAPAGFFGLGKKKVTVPAKGTAKVPLTVDTRLGGDRNGAYSGFVTATGGGQTVRTAAAVDREIESYDLTLKFIGADGKPSKSYRGSVLGLSGEALGTSADVYGTPGGATLRVPKGGYVLDSVVIQPGAREGQETYHWINQPKLTVNGKTTVTVDARKTKPVKVAIPSKKAVSTFASPSFTVISGEYSAGYGWFLDSYENFRTAHLGPDSAKGTLVQQWDAHWKEGANTEYHVVLGGAVKRLGTGYQRTVTAGDLAKVAYRQGAPAAGKQGGVTAFGYLPANTGASAVTSYRKLPVTTTLYLSDLDGVKWEGYFEQTGGKDADGFPITESQHNLPARAYQGGKSYHEVLNTGVFGPAHGGEYSPFRLGDEIAGALPLFADGAGRVGYSTYTKAETVLSSGGTVIDRSPTPLDGSAVFKVPAAEAAYHLAVTAERSTKQSRVSTRVEAAWDFRSGHVSGNKPKQLPLSVVRFTPKLDDDSRVKAGTELTVPVTVQGPAAGKGLKSLKAYVSFDGGATWKVLTVKNGKAVVKSPAAGKSVSFRGVVRDTKGNTSEVRVIRAYLAK